jgi:hypothetical protein
MNKASVSNRDVITGYIQVYFYSSQVASSGNYTVKLWSRLFGMHSDGLHWQLWFCHVSQRCTNHLTPELNPSAQSCLTRFFSGNFASWTAHFFNIGVKNQQIHQVFIQFINYVWYLLNVWSLHFHSQRAFLVPYERCSIEEQSIEYCGCACCV